MECDGDDCGSNKGVDKEIGLGFDVKCGVGEIRVEKMGVEELGKKKRSAEVKDGVESDDDEPIGSMFKVVKSRKNAKKVKVECDGGLGFEKVEVDGGLDDTLAAFRKKLKKGPRVCAPKGGGLDTVVKKTETVVKEPNVCEDGTVECVKKGLKSSGKEKKKTSVKKSSGENLTEEDKEGGLEVKGGDKEKKKRSKSKSAKKAVGENLTQNDLEDSLSAFLLKAQSGSLWKSRKALKHKQDKTTQACHDGSEQKPNDPATVEIGANERFDPTGNEVINDVLNHSSSEITKSTNGVSEIEVQEKKTDPTCAIPKSVPIAGFITNATSPADQKNSPILLVHDENMNQGSIPNTVDGVVLDQFQVGSRSDCDSPKNEIVSVSSCKENASTSDGRLSPVSLPECNKFADENEAYASENGSMPDPETKFNNKSGVKRIMRQAKRHRHDDMAYEGDAYWDTLIHEQNFYVDNEDGEKVQSVKMKGKLDFLQTFAMEAESSGVAAVSVGLKARAASPIEKMKFKELLKRKGGLQEYIECRNHILHLWNKDVTRILPLSECGISDTAVADEHPQASLIRDIYSFLDQYSYINFGVASKKDISDSSIKPNFTLSREDNDGIKSGTPVTDLDDGVSFILGRTKNYDNLNDETDTATECPDSIIGKDKDLDVSDPQCGRLSNGCYAQAVDPINQKEPTVCIQCDDSDSETRKKIIVIGAGPAGLTAARHLSRLGFHVTVLEARDRVGGRVFTDHSSLSVPVDLGASIITGVEADVTSQRRPDPSSLICAQLGLELTVLNSDCPLYDTVTGQKVPPELDEAVEAEYNSLLDDMQLVVAQKGDHAMQMSLEEGLEYGLKIQRAGPGSDNTGTKEEILSPLERRVMDWHLAHLEYGCAASLQHVSLPYWNQDDVYGGFGGAHCMIKGGYGAIVDSLKDGLHIHLNCIVTDIYRQQEDESQKKVKVCTQNGKIFTGDAVLITVPLGCLKAETIKFSPSLPEWKYSSIKRLGFGVLNKVILEFPEVFWDDSVDYFGATAEQTDQRGWCFMFWNVKKTVNAPVLIALVVGKAAINDQDLTPSDHVNHALAVLRKLFGKTAVCDPVASVVTDWGRDPFSYGAYSYVAVGASGEDYDTLGRPVDNCLFFAGEATCKEHPDTVGGAMMSGLREAVRIVDILTTGNDFTAEVEAIAAAKRHSNSERSEVRDIIKRLDAIELTDAHKNSLLQNMFCNTKSRAARLHLAKELLNLPSNVLKSFAGTKEGLAILNSWILDSMGKNGTQLLRQCVRLLVLVSTDLLAVRLSGIGKTVKEKVCVHTSRDIRAIASQLVSVWVEIFRKEKASNGGLKLLRQSGAADASRSKSHSASGKPPLRAHHKVVTKPENKPSSSQGSAGKQNCKEEDDKDLPMTEEEQAAFDAAEAARAAAIAAAEAYASSGVKSSTPVHLPKIPSFNKFARREQYAQMDESELRKKWAGGVTGRQECISEIKSRNCRVQDWSVDFSAAGVNLENSKMLVDDHNRSQRSHSNENAGPLGYREHSGEHESTGGDNIFTKAWVDSTGSEGIKDHSAIERWQSQAAAADFDFYNRSMHAMNEEESNKNLKPLVHRHDGLANDSSASQVTVNRELMGNQPRGVDKIKQSVVDYVASLLMPLYKTRKIDKESYKSIMKKTATKVMVHITDAEKAMPVFEFLDNKRKNKIRTFVDDLIERYMAMKTDAKSAGS
ncbi:putative spermine oxidase transcription regulator SWI/SNF-SWI3 family [Helianthus annuus]|uniref:Putative LSD1-like 3 n=1 Tax=Helianthus annuus TaxID=4232 RepID=A0A251TZQ3_HELAN|nr:lysine-specific histone demethylase 1 homolog 3 isoform X1 [Helianthus annuus]XP_021983780.1 lysine-specific histone demethylase 1 homolog 3 isoform X1 [Helianthus annuus]XP_021983781.1 lysine-specific histone demethylase 1 homolog 3 isoform X1 [Helianthus annuus]KAF5792544.1 putative spermine oxidase transcription regulator SWI/SNF-SWI3 family [Helianthus annuus]KAJ0536201.1 putative spermine oxidase transcription regulator Homeodomain-LIKE family [Helianthus annuus]KAJ0894799.1 putative s